MPDALVELQEVTKSFGEAVVTEVLHGIDVTLERGEFTALMGPSGSGKSTLLNLVGLLDRPSGGRILVAGENTGTLDETALTALRSRTIGFIFQFHHLVGALTAAENLVMPLAIQAGRLTAELRARATEALGEVGLADRADARPDELSGGQQQRIAIARALIHRPPLVLADEPTGNLDTGTADDIFALLRRFNTESGTTFLIVTHDPRLARRCDRVISLVDGRVAGDGPPAQQAGTVQ